MCIQCLGHFSPISPHYQAETILPLALILLKREYMQYSWDKDSYTGSLFALLSCTFVLHSKLILL
jgi:hypothetical protein